MLPKNNDYSIIKSIQSRYFSFRSQSELVAPLASPSEHRGCLFLFHAENHLFHAGNSTNKSNSFPIGWVRHVAHRPKDFVKIIVVVGPEPQVGRHVDVFAANKRFLFV
jgi:hypothetical protein